MKKSLIALSISSILSASAYADIVITEYVEGSSSNKAIELFNNGSDVESLDGYSLARFKDGNETESTMVDLSGNVLKPSEVVVVRNNETDTPLSSSIKVITSSSLVHNGGDAVALMHNGSVMDIVGDVPTTKNWGKDKTLRRLNTTPSALYNEAEWEEFPKNTNDGLGLVDGVTPPEPTPDPEPSIKISELQGSGWASPYTDPANNKFISDEKFTVVGIITAVQTEALDGDLPVGFFMQDETPDNDPKTSDGIFVVSDVSGITIGDKIEVTGLVEEHYGWTRLLANESKVVGTGTVTATELETSFSDTDFDFTLERHEGMLVKLTSVSDMKVTRSYALDSGPKRFNMVLSNAVLSEHPNQHAFPSSDESLKQADCITDKRLVVESFEKVTSGTPPWYPEFGATDVDQNGSTDDYIRVADTVNNMEGVIGYSYSDYRFYVTENANKDSFVSDTDRDNLLTLNEGDIRIATFNTQQYFNSLQGGGSNNPHLSSDIEYGAQSSEAFTLQTEKLVTALKTLNADIVGLMEIENNGFDESSAISYLVTQLNLELDEADQYHIASNEGLTYVGSLATSNQVIYRASKVGLDSLKVWSMPEQRGENIGETFSQHDALIPTFTFKDRDEKLTVAVSHLKDKQTPCLDDMATNEQLLDSDYQGSCENLRVSAADYLGQKLAEIEGEKIILGSLNSYASEDPMLVLTQREGINEEYQIHAAINTYVDDKKLHGEAGGVIETSYGYDNPLQILHPNSYNTVSNDAVGSLDYILTSAGLKSKIIDAMQWNINAGESALLSYENAAALGQEYRDEFRSAVHDPVVISISFDGKPIEPVDPIYPENPDQPIVPGTPVKLPSEPLNEPRPITPVDGQGFEHFVDLTAAGAGTYLKVGDEVVVSITNANGAYVATASNVAKDTLNEFEIALGWTEVTFNQGLSTGEYAVTTTVDGEMIDSSTLVVAKNSESDGGSAGVSGLLALLGFGFLRSKQNK